MPDPIRNVLELGTLAQISALEAEVQGEIDARGRRIWRAMMLAPSLEICEALLRGENVPLDQLDPKWVSRFGLRETNAA